jgi:hypothetical protein
MRPAASDKPRSFMMVKLGSREEACDVKRRKKRVGGYRNCCYAHAPST